MTRYTSYWSNWLEKPCAASIDEMMFVSLAYDLWNTFQHLFEDWTSLSEYQ